MCTSIANGGRRCKRHEAQVAMNKLKKATARGNVEDIKEAKKEYFQTEEGVERLEAAGKTELAERFRALRNRTIETHNAHWGTKHKTMPSKLERMARTHTLRGFHKKTLIHAITGTAYDQDGWSHDYIHKDTGTDLAPDGFSWYGKDAGGFNREGFNSQGYNRQGFKKNGRDRDGYNAEGFNVQGYNRDGYNDEGWDYSGIHVSTGESYDIDGYDRAGYHHITGINKETGMTHSEELNDRFGYKPQSPVSA